MKRGAALAPRPPERNEEAGTLVVRATPWAQVAVDGVDVGETPYEGAVLARRHRVRAHHPTLGDDEIFVELAPGERFVWRPRLERVR